MSEKPNTGGQGPASTKIVMAKLRCLDHRGETIHTRWGDVSFDKDGLAELEVPEAELQMLRDVRPHSWLADDHQSYNHNDSGKSDKKVAPAPGKSDGKKQ